MEPVFRVRPTKMYIAFRHKKGFAGIVVLKSKLKAYLRIDMSQPQDPLKKARDVKKIGHYSHGDTEMVISERSEIPYALPLLNRLMKEISLWKLQFFSNLFYF